MRDPEVGIAYNRATVLLCPEAKPPRLSPEAEPLRERIVFSLSISIVLRQEAPPRFFAWQTQPMHTEASGTPSRISRNHSR